LRRVATIAVVDDDEAIREALSDLLLVLGFACHTFERAEALLAEYQPGVFDCVITDVHMPGIGGLALLQRLREIDASLPVVIITSDADPLTRGRAMAAGAHAFLTKPVADHVLLPHLESALVLNDGNARKGSSDA
jgi:two-component system response regulator FixJ